MDEPVQSQQWGFVRSPNGWLFYFIMAKDPAVLIYFDKWISSTNGIKAEFRAWYLDLLIYQYDKGGLPNDEDTLAGICRVLPSEYAKFTQMRTQVIAQKFTQCDDGMLRNETMNDILRKREAFKEKKSRAGYIGNIVKELNKSGTFTTIEVSTIKDKLRVCIDEEFEEVLSIYRLKDYTHLRTHLRTLYIDVDEDVDINKNVVKIKKEKKESKNLSKIENSVTSQIDPFVLIWDKWKKFKKDQFKFSYKSEESEKLAKQELLDLSGGNPEIALAIVDQSMKSGYKGLFELKESTKKIDRVTKNEQTTLQAWDLFKKENGLNEI